MTVRGRPFRKGFDERRVMSAALRSARLRRRDAYELGLLSLPRVRDLDRAAKRHAYADPGASAEWRKGR